MKKNNIIIIILIIVIFHITYPRILPNILGLLMPIKNDEPLDVVVAHYKEDLSWIDSLLPKNCRIFIYSKSNMIPNCKRKYIHKVLENVGRCDHTYLYHIINNYDKKLNKNTLFLPGSCNLLYKKIQLIILLKNIGKFKINNLPLMKKSIISDDYNKYMIRIAIKNGYCSTDLNNKHKDCSLKKYKFNNYKEFINYFNLNIKYYTLGGLHQIKTKIIYNRPKKFYNKILKVLDHADNTLNGHFLERSFHSILVEK